MCVVKGSISSIRRVPSKENGLLWWLSGKESISQFRRHRFNPWIRKILWRRKWQPTPVLLLLLSRFIRVQLCATPWTAAYQAPPSVGFARQEYWSGLPLLSLHSSILAWKIPWMEEAGRLQFVGLQKSLYMTWKLNTNTVYYIHTKYHTYFKCISW